MPRPGPRPYAKGDVRLSFDRSPDEVGVAREFAAEAVEGSGFSLDDVALVVTELAANAVRHAVTPFTVRLSCHGSLRVEVVDRSPDLPIRPVHPAGVDVGRGLQIVEAVSSSWGVEATRPDGKTVWAEVRMDETG